MLDAFLEHPFFLNRHSLDTCGVHSGTSGGQARASARRGDNWNAEDADDEAVPFHLDEPK